MAFVALVRKDVLDHAIWTVTVVSHPVVTDHHRRHSLELVSVEAPVIEIVCVHYKRLATIFENSCVQTLANQ